MPYAWMSPSLVESSMPSTSGNTSADARRSVAILLVEDDDGHADLIEESLREAGVVNRILRAHDGQEALDRVRGEGAFEGQGGFVPFLILLDINMPRVDGIEVLREIKSDDRFKHIPVIMLTTTDNPRDIERCYQLGCNTYITKPVGFTDFANCVKQLGLFTQIIQLPTSNPA